MLNMDTSSAKMITLNWSNYQVWKRKLEDILYVNDCFLFFLMRSLTTKLIENWNYVIGKCVGL